MGSHSKDRSRDATQNGFCLSAVLPRVVTGVTAAASALAATLYIFGPFSDLSARQLAAGPNSTQIGAGNIPLVMARTGRSWRGASKRAEHDTSLVLIAKAGPSRQTLAGTLPSHSPWQHAEQAYGSESTQPMQLKTQ